MPRAKRLRYTANVGEGTELKQQEDSKVTQVKVKKKTDDVISLVKSGPATSAATSAATTWRRRRQQHGEIRRSQSARREALASGSVCLRTGLSVVQILSGQKS